MHFKLLRKLIQIYKRGKDLNLRPLAYETSELPLLHPISRKENFGSLKSVMHSIGLEPITVSLEG